jgi:hypothetical protein
LTNLPLIRTEYMNVSTGTVRGGSTGRGESLTDMESYVLPVAQILGSSLHTWGVADGFQIDATPGQPGLTISPGCALDGVGHLITIAVEGFAITDPSVDPSQIVNVPTVPVGPDGVVLDTAALTGALVLTVSWREVLEGQLANAPVLVHAPWLRLLAAADVPADGSQVVLAAVGLDAAGAVTTLAPGARRGCSARQGRLELRRPKGSSGPPLSVGDVPAAELRPRPDGGLDLNLLEPTVPVLGVDVAASALTLLAGGGSVGIGTTDAPQRSLHVQGSEIHSGGSGAGLSFSDRSVPAFVEVPTAGERWSWYAQDGAARLWSGVDVLSVSRSGDGMQLQTPTPGSSVELGASGGTIGTLALAADTVTVRRADGTRPVTVDGLAGRVGIGTDSPTHRLHVDGFGGLRQNEIYLGGGRGWSSLSYNAFHNDANSNWVFPDPSRGAVTVEIDDAGNVPRFQVWTTPTSNTQSFQLRLAVDGNTGAVDVPGRLSVDGAGVPDQGATVTLQNNNPTANALCALTGGGTVFQAAGKDRAMTAFGPSSLIGDVDVSGTLTARSKQFVIDHPVDPENRTLVHASVESSERLVTYSGNTTCDDAGEARVQLPSWIEPLATDFRFQLTCIGGHAPVFVARELQDGAFVIAGGTAGLRVSWQVSGVRHDAWARANVLEVEVDKPASERGFYHAPEAYGQTLASSVHWPRHQGLVEQQPRAVRAFIESRAEQETDRRAAYERRVASRLADGDTP